MDDDDLFAARRASWQFSQRLAVHFSNRLTEAGFSAAKMLAAYLDLSPGQVRDRLDGIEPWTVVDLHRLALLFDTSVSELLGEAES
jgi:hypothetical protein